MSIKTEILTGIRPTGDLTLGNYLGSIKPIIDLQEDASEVLVFVADLHGLTDQEPDVVVKNRLGLVADLLALGLDLNKSNIFLQSAVKDQILLMSMLLSRHITIAELLRVPALKDKLKDETKPERATAMLANYPIMMAADILLQGAEFVPVGEDQISHIEVTRLLARRFNNRYSDVLREPKPQTMKPLRIIALNGDGKMSKSNPSGAVLLNDNVEETKGKIKRAETAVEGEMNPALESHFEVAQSLAGEKDAQEIANLKQRHLSGEKVMGQFKDKLAELVVNFISDYQQKKQIVLNDKNSVSDVLRKGNEIATKNADSVIYECLQASGLKL